MMQMNVNNLYIKYDSNIKKCIDFTCLNCSCQFLKCMTK